VTSKLPSLAAFATSQLAVPVTFDAELDLHGVGCEILDLFQHLFRGGERRRSAVFDPARYVTRAGWLESGDRLDFELDDRLIVDLVSDDLGRQRRTSIPPCGHASIVAAGATPFSPSAMLHAGPGLGNGASMIHLCLIETLRSCTRL
jgi:hypothetical protein